MENIKDIDFLQEAPDSATDNGYGALHIPIVPLEVDMDRFAWSTRNYNFHLYKDGYANLCVGASLELLLTISGKERSFVGCCNFTLASILPIQDWNATAKSLCIKNAASEAGKRLGRGLNSEIIPDRTPREKSMVKTKPDSKIMQQFMDAVLNKDEATINLLSNIYDIKIGDNAEEK